MKFHIYTIYISVIPFGKQEVEVYYCYYKSYLRIFRNGKTVRKGLTKHVKMSVKNVLKKIFDKKVKYNSHINNYIIIHFS